MSDSENTDGVESEVVETVEVDTTDKAASGILKDLQKEREARRAIQAQLEQLQKAQEEAARKQAEEQGEYKRLYEEAATKLEPLTQEVETYRQREAARIEAQQQKQQERKSALPETARMLIPDGIEGDALDAQLAKLEALVSKGSESLVAIGGRATGGGGDDSKLTEAEKKHAELYGLSGVSPATIKKHYAKTHQKRA